jgi:DNA-binding MarR family transcriptional regulator
MRSSPTTTAEPATRPSLTARDPRLADWRALLQAHALLIRRLDEELRAEHDLSLAEYETLLHLAASPDRQLRMNSLADQVLLSRSGITRLVDRLESTGLVRRQQCATDHRGSWAVLTVTGLERLRSASRTHLRGIDEHFMAVIEPADLAAIGRSMTAVAERLAETGGVETGGGPAEAEVPALP